MAKLALGDLAAAGDYLGRAKQACHENDEHWLEADIYRLEAALKEASYLDPEIYLQAYAGAEASEPKLGAKPASRWASSDMPISFTKWESAKSIGRITRRRRHCR